MLDIRLVIDSNYILRIQL